MTPPLRRKTAVCRLLPVDRSDRTCRSSLTAIPWDSRAPRYFGVERQTVGWCERVRGWGWAGEGSAEPDMQQRSTGAAWGTAFRGYAGALKQNLSPAELFWTLQRSCGPSSGHPTISRLSGVVCCHRRGPMSTAAFGLGLSEGGRSGHRGSVAFQSADTCMMPHALSSPQMSYAVRRWSCMHRPHFDPKSGILSTDGVALFHHKSACGELYAHLNAPMEDCVFQRRPYAPTLCGKGSVVQM